MIGQSMVFEHVLLFAMGVVIFIISFAVFNVYQMYFLSISTTDQLTGVKDIVASNILKLSEKGNGDDINSSITLNIPERVGNEPYTLILTNRGINVTIPTTGMFVFSPIYGLNEDFEMLGRISSTTGMFLIYKKGNKIIIT